MTDDQSDYETLPCPLIDGQQISREFMLPHSADHLRRDHPGRDERDAWARAYWRAHRPQNR